MIVAKLADLSHQIAMTPATEAGLAYLAQLNVEDLMDGASEIEGGRIQVLVRTYVGAADGRLTFEGHQHCVEFQYLVSGAMGLGWAPRELARVTQPYDEAKDSWMGAVADETASQILLRQRQVAVFYPEDAHALGATPDGPARKVTLKIALGA